MSGENVTNKKSNSLYTYRDSIDANSNKGWQQYNPSVSSASQMAAYNTPLFNRASGYPGVTNWPNNWVSSDPILNFGSTSSDLSCGGNGFINTLGYITGGISALTSLVGLGTGIASLFKKDNGGSSSTEAADSTLAGLTETANNYDKKSNQKAMMDTSTSLQKQRDNANTRLATAYRNRSTAEATLTSLSGQKNYWAKQLETFDAGKGELIDQITDFQNKIDELNPGENYGAQKTELEGEIAKIQAQIDENYSEAKRKEITDQITSIEEQEQEWQLLIDEANKDIAQLPGEISEADKAIKRLNKLIGNDD